MSEVPGRRCRRSREDGSCSLPKHHTAKAALFIIIIIIIIIIMIIIIIIIFYYLLHGGRLPHHRLLNLTCPGFAQFNKNWFLGGSFSHYSKAGGTQYVLEMQWLLNHGNWWLFLTGEAVGDYPQSVHYGGQLTRNSTLIEFGGETVGSAIWPSMGSGAFSDRGFGQAALQSQVESSEKLLKLAVISIDTGRVLQ
jgi:hypothetical protein